MTHCYQHPGSAITRKGYFAYLVTGAAFAAPVLAFDIVFDYTYDTGFFNDTNKAILDEAASFFETYITDDFTAITSGGSNHFSAIFTNPGDRTSQVTLTDFDVAADTIVVFVGGYDYGTGSTTLGSGGYGGYSISGVDSFIDNAVTRGETATREGVRNPDAATKSAVDFATWGGSVSFNSTTSWYFDTDVSTNEAFTGADFYSVALHELGHVLGLGTADSWDNKIIGDQFTGAASVAAYGGNLVPLQSSGGHWADGTQSRIYGTSTGQEAAMDPNIVLGTRKVFTDLDMAGLEDVGWEIQSASSGE